MAKPKNKKKLSDNIQKKKANLFKPKSVNPFEVHLNREKLKVLGKKSKNEKGLPGVSRAKALKKRKHTLLQEYKIQNKSNKFTDKRIGERNGAITDADKAMMRFAASRIKAHKKKNIFNLAEDELITHKGQSLQEIEKFDDPRSDDELENDEQGRLDSNFVKDAHFGGGIFTNSGKEGATSHKQLIDQLIEESKKRKAEQQRTKEATLELTEKLDTDWKDLIQIVTKSNKEMALEETPVKSKVDDYDKTLKELRFEKRGTVSDRLKTETEVEQESKEKIEKLEQERLERMQADFVDTVNRPHRSADDLDDDFVYEPDTGQTLSYDQEGKSNLKIAAELNGHVIGDSSAKNNDEPNSVNSESEDEEIEEDVDNNENSSSESDDSLADLKETEENSESEMEVEAVDKSLKISNSKQNPKKLHEDTSQNIQKKSEEINFNHLPMTLDLPESYDKLIETLQHRTPAEQGILLQRMISCNDPSISQGNKEQLGLLFAYLLQYLNDIFGEVDDVDSLTLNFDIFKSIMPSLYKLAEVSAINAHNSLLEVIKEKHSEYKSTPSRYPGLEVLVFFKLISLLFTTSDFRHQVVTPSFVFMEQMLTKCRVNNGKDVAYGLFICTLFLEYTALSNRYLPAVINFLSGLLHMSIPKSSVRLIKAPHPFKSLNSYLVLTKDCSKLKTKCKIDPSTLVIKEIDDAFRISVLYVILKVLREFTEKYKHLSSNVEIFSLAINYLDQIPVNKYPKEVQNEFSSLAEHLKMLEADRRLFYVVMEQKKPKALRLYEPKFETIYDTKRHKGKSKEKAEQDKLLYKYKKERKGALREIRRDKAFLGRVKIKQKIQSDIERKEKVNRILAEAASQQSELNAMDRKNKKKS